MKKRLEKIKKQDTRIAKALIECGAIVLQMALDVLLQRNKSFIWRQRRSALKVIGESKDDVKIRASLYIKGKKEEDVFFTDLTVTGAKSTGVYGEGAAMHLKNVCVEKCGRSGVCVCSTTRNTMTDCNVNNNEYSGVYVGAGGRMVIDGSETTIHHNGTGGRDDDYGLETGGSPASIHLKSLTKESISTDNGGGGNCGGNCREQP